MRIKYLFILFLVVLPLSNDIVIAQDKYLEVEQFFRQEIADSLKIKGLQKRLAHFINNRDTLNIANTYFFLSNIRNNNTIAYADSIIIITKNKNYFRYPAEGYFIKANTNYQLGNYIKALELYIKASEAAKKNGNNRHYQAIKFNIGLLKNNAGDRKESEIIFADYVAFLDQNPTYRNRYNYNPGLFALADAYIHNKNLKLAEITIKKGIRETLKTKDSINYSYILVTSGIHQYLLNKYNKSIDSLKKGKKIIQKLDPLETRIATCDYYIGKSYKKLGNIEKSIIHFQKADTILRKTKDVIPEIIDVYDYLRAYAKSKNDYKLQIEYINTQLKLDSILHANQIHLTRNITRKYDAAELISEKEILIKQLEKDTFLKDNTISFLIIFSLILILIAIFGYRRSHVNKIRFQKLLEQQKANKENQSELIDTIQNDLVKKEDIDIPDDVVKSILKKLIDFEDQNRFARKHYTLNSLAKELQTNSAYLSKIINVYKNVNFANYLNNLRIDFAVDQLTINKSLRSYTIQAIAEEVGFKNAQSFSSAFHKKTGIYPSYFIKHLDN